MGKKEAPADAELDDLGLVVHTYVSKVLVVLPAGGYDEATMRYARSALYNVHVRTEVVSVGDEDVLEGGMQDLLVADGKLEDASLDEYAGVIFVDGPAAAEMADNSAVQRLAKEAMQAGKLVSAWGNSVLVLARAGVVKGRKMTGADAHASALKAAGARFSRAQVVIDDRLVTASDRAAGFRLAKGLVSVVGIG